MKFNIIYADCPWKYENNRYQGVAENHYKTLTMGEICSLPIKDITAENAILFLWATFPMLKEALQTIDGWGFSFKTVAFVWVKKNKVADSYFFGLGHWTRSNAEICLLAVKGHPQRIHNGISQLIVSPIERHSKKPDIVREKIVELAGDLPRIELFAWQSYPGWVCLGNEIDGKDIRDSLQECIQMTMPPNLSQGAKSEADKYV